MSSKAAQEWIARLYVERNRLYEVLPYARLILNLGCGSGSFVKNYAHPHCLIVNLDKGEPVAGYPAYGLRHKTFSGFAELDPDSRCLNVKGDALERIVFLPSNTFGMVILGQIVEHFQTRDLEILLHEVGRVLTPGGYVQVDTVTDRLGEDVDGHEQHFTSESLHLLLERMVFKRVTLSEFAGGAALWALYRKP